MNCLSILFCNIRCQTVTQNVLRVFCLEISHCNFQRRLPLRGAAESRKTKKSMLRRVEMFVCAVPENPAQRMIGRDSVPPETYFQLLIEMFRVTWFFTWMTCTEVNAFGKFGV